MPNSRSIPPEAWAHARDALVRLFASRYGRADAEDLAQEVLCRVFARENYEFDNVDNFLNICKGFARNVAHEQFRLKSRYSDLEFDVAAPGHGAAGQRAIEARILLEEICKKGKERLRSTEWSAICEAALEGDGAFEGLPRGAATSRERVFLHRTRAKLREIIARRKRE